MIIIEPNSTTYTFKIIPSVYEAGEMYYIKITDEQENKVTFSDFSTLVENNSDITEVTFMVSEDYFKENYFYNISFSLSNEVVYKTKVLATSQAVLDYSINNNNYVLPTINNNEYIII
tara:strand:- start:964 stop:1317 length:354 start_codon:yes stop_codon:yes gene_type:complete